MAVPARTAAVAAPAPAPARAAPRRTQRQRAARRGVVGGIVWIVALAALLAGVVALNVALLDANLQLDRLARERADLRATNAQLQSQLSRAGAPQRIDAAARSRLGLVPAGPEQTRFVEIPK
jgi:cell division protein FtsL